MDLRIILLCSIAYVAIGTIATCFAWGYRFPSDRQLAAIFLAWPLLLVIAAVRGVWEFWKGTEE